MLDPGTKILCAAKGGKKKREGSNDNSFRVGFSFFSFRFFENIN